MPDMGWTEYISSIEKMEWLGSLTVTETTDEFGNKRFFVTDYEDEWVGNPFDTREAALKEIERLRNSD